MSANDQEPVRRRKLSLNKKTPTQHRGTIRSSITNGLECTPKSTQIQLPRKSLRSLRGVNPNVESSDDLLEIGWNNNSPSPSSCAKPTKRNGRSKKDDISAILKNVPRMKKTQDKDKKEEDQQALVTWLQDDLAVNTFSARKTTKKSNRKSRNRDENRGKAMELFKELKNDLVSHTDSGVSARETDSAPVDSTPLRRSQQTSRRDNDLPSVSPIDVLHNECPVDVPICDSPFNNKLTSKIPEDAQPCKNPVGKQLVPEDTFDNINWSYIHTPDTKKSCGKNEMNSVVTNDVSTNKNTACENVNAATKPNPCKNLYKVDNGPMDPSSTKVTQKTESCSNGNSLMNINFDDDFVECPDLPDTLPIVSESVSCKPALTENVMVNNKGISTPCKLPSNAENEYNENSLMNIDFDDDLDEILTSQPVDDEESNEREKPELDMVGNNELKMDDKDFSMIDDDKDISMLLEDPLVEKEECMVLSNSLIDEKDTSMLLDDNFSDALDQLDNDKKKTSLDGNHTATNKPKEIPQSTSNQKPTNDLIGFDDADDLFDDIVVSLDGAVKCKSQETPPQSITDDQRKMKSRCHTSPYPLSSKRTLLVNDNKTSDVASFTSNDADQRSATNKLSSNIKNVAKGKDFKEATLKRPPDKPTCESNQKHLGSMHDSNKLLHQNGTNKSNFSTKNGYTFQSNKINGDAPQSNNSTLSNELPLDVSIIEKKHSRIEPDASICFSKPDAKLDLFTSTQKCSFSEIQRKREEAQLKLKQKNRWKK